MKKSSSTPTAQALELLISAALKNAADLVSEAHILSANGRWARTHFLASTALEELSKAQLLADVLAGDLPPDAFAQALSLHGRKFSFMKRQASAPQQVSPSAGAFALVAKRQREASLYVDLTTNGAVSEPSLDIGEAQARDTLQSAHNELSAANFLSLFPAGLSTKGAQLYADALKKHGA